MMDREPGCGDNSCVFSCIRPSGGMRTNGGCRCFTELDLHTNIQNTMKVFNPAEPDFVPYDNRQQVRHLRNSVMLLARAYIDLKNGKA